MTKSAASILFLMLAGCASQTELRSSAPAGMHLEQAKRQTHYPAVQAFADEAVKTGRVPGMAIAIAFGTDSTTFISSGRLTTEAGSSIVNPDSLWRIYSMTKPITGIAAMILVDDGKLRLDQPVSDFIPSFATSQVLVDPDKSLVTRPAIRPITIRDLLTHSSGLNYATVSNGLANSALRRQGLIPFMLNRSTESEIAPLRPKSLAEFGDRAGHSALIADPGTRFSYSMGLDVLAAVVEKAAGVPFENFLEKRLFRPLGMRSTYWQVPQTETFRLAANYIPQSVAHYVIPGFVSSSGSSLALVDGSQDSVFLNKPSFAFGGAGLVSSARDYDRFLQMLAGGGKFGRVRILTPKTAELAMSNLLPSGVLMKDFGPVPPGEETGFGAGGFVTLVDKDGFGRRRGTFGWDGIAGSRAWTDPVRHIRVTLMINTSGVPGIGADFDKAVARDFAAGNQHD